VRFFRPRICRSISIQIVCNSFLRRRGATYAVTVEPPGGSPTGVATGPIVYVGKLIEAVP
jgi:anti-sigma-K factor RskA